jgi:cyclin-dependent kinase 10
VVTLWYRAPELLLGAEDYTTAIDTWSIGCVMGELLLGQPLLPGDEERSQIKLIIDLLGCPNDKIWPGVAELPLIANGSINLAQELARSPYNSLNVVFPKLGHHGINLLNLLLAYDSKKRICPNRVSLMTATRIY